MKKISAIIPTYNEENNIKEAIKSLDFVDEIIIVDSYSTDKTIEIAKPLVDKIFQRNYENSAEQKNWALNKVENEWVIILDADERISKELKNEILNLKNRTINYNGFWIKRMNYFMRKRVYFSGWQGDKVIRLFKRSVCKYEKKNVHAEIFSDGEIGMLKNKIIHNTYKSKTDYLDKLNRYAKWQAKDYDKKTKKITFLHLHIKPILRFLKHFVFHLGFLDGYIGFVISIYQYKAVSLRYKYLKIYRAKNNQRNC